MGKRVARTHQPPTAETTTLDPYLQLVVAIVRQALSDAQGGRIGEAGWSAARQQMVRAEAQAFLADTCGDLSWWVELLDMDVDHVRRLLPPGACVS